MVPRGLEPRTLRLLAVRSNQLSYETHVKNSEWGQDPMTPGPQDPRPQDPGHQDPRLQDPPPQDPRPQDPQPHVLKFFKFSLGCLLKLSLTPGSRNARYRTPGSTTPGSRSQDPRPQGSGRQDPPPQDPRPQLLNFLKFSLGGLLKLSSTPGSKTQEASFVLKSRRHPEDFPGGPPPQY